MLTMLTHLALGVSGMAPRGLVRAIPHYARCASPANIVTGPLSGPLPSDFKLPPGRSGIILFDGVCNFCNRWVSFVQDNDPEGSFAFASLQSDKGRELLQTIGREANDLSTFVVITEDGFYTQSTAALRVGQELKVPALNTVASTLENIPEPIRDSFYRLVAENRYSILGRDEDGATPSCQLRSDSMLVAERFLQ